MQAIIDAFNWIIDTIKTLMEFVTSFFSNLGMLAKYIGLVATMCYDLVATLPPWLQAFGTLTILVCVLYMILGRQTGGQKE